MILETNDLIDWIADRELLLITAWTPELVAALEWNEPLAEALAGELHAAMMTTLLRRGTESNFLNLIARSGIGIEPKAEKAVAGRFYDVTLKLARAASRRRREEASRLIFAYRRATVVNDDRAKPGYHALDGILLPFDHPFWRRWYPPIDIDDCRCSVAPVTRSQFARLGEPVTSEDELAERESRLSAAWPPAFERLLDFQRV
ncbi:uncharacterized protein with gpF-like domain [Novosphingobium fluoreni]|uniref:Uncharacterized protein with gpF-like domain n=1 Tax=Novosphingobium fluoreni TaxID=1391222 RepID=A0A7W6FZX1_9SPHN|nr:hypothetical protein [Novosphingobium fluoreni]MBB3941761.1 uncharacterized protein with gpF-like domain [Novosphingobium fluoreni]